MDNSEKNELCKTCFFAFYCAGMKLPYCDGKDYVKQLFDANGDETL